LNKQNKYQIKNIKSHQSWTDFDCISIEIEVQLRFGASGVSVAPIDLQSYFDQITNSRLEKVLIKIQLFMKMVESLLKGKASNDQLEIDEILEHLIKSETSNKIEKLMLAATSMANLKAAASANQIPLWHYISSILNNYAVQRLPLPEVEIPKLSILNNSKHQSPDLRILPLGAESFAQALINCSKVLKKLEAYQKSAPFLRITSALDNIVIGIERAGFKPGLDFAISLNLNSRSLNNSQKYEIPGDNIRVSGDELCGLLIDCVEKYPIASIQDPFRTDDYVSWEHFNWAVGKRVQIINSENLNLFCGGTQTASASSFQNSIMIKNPNHLTMSAINNTLNAAKTAGLDSFFCPGRDSPSISTITHLSVGLGLKQLRLHKISSGNEALRIANQMHSITKSQSPADGALPPKSSFFGIT